MIAILTFEMKSGANIVSDSLSWSVLWLLRMCWAQAFYWKNQEWWSRTGRWPLQEYHLPAHLYRMPEYWKMRWLLQWDFSGCPPVSLVHIFMAWLSLPWFTWSPNCPLNSSHTKLFGTPHTPSCILKPSPYCSSDLLTPRRAAERTVPAPLPQGWLRAPSRLYQPLLPSIFTFIPQYPHL